MRFVRKCAALIVASVALLALLARERQQAAQAAQGRWSQVALQLREENQALSSRLALREAGSERLALRDAFAPDFAGAAQTAVARSPGPPAAPSQPGIEHCDDDVQSIPRGVTSGHQILQEPPAKCRKFIAVVTPVTSRGPNQSLSSVADTPFVESFIGSAMLSLANSADAGYDVAFYIGHDVGDRIWDTDRARSDIVDVVQRRVDAIYSGEWRQRTSTETLLPMVNVTRIGLSIKMVRCQGHSMVSASNCAISQAYQDGAEYWYRVNDDTVFLTTSWIQDFNAALASFDPPNVGAVGPADNINFKILTYDYVHRTHFEIFRFQYPLFLKNWWCDDWITYVYGESLV